MILSYLCSWLTTTKKEACIVLREKATKAVNMGTQMLANMMTCNPELQDKMWPLFFKDSDLLKQLLITSEGPSSRYVLTCIRNCTYKDTQHCAYLTSTASGREVLKLLLCAACRYVSDEASNTFDIVNMIELELTPRIMEALCCGKDPSRKHIFSCEHITFLKLLDGMVDARSNSDRPLVGIGIDTNVFMVKLFGKLVRNAERIAAQEKTVDASAFGMDVDGMILLLQYMGRVTQDLGPDAKVKLVQEGLGEALMILLKLANRIQPRTKPGGKQEPPKEGNRGLFMVKSDIVKVVGNLAYEAKEVQDEFRRIGAMPMILDQCNIDDNNPFIKENAIFALRNLCDGNFENQSIIAAMEARGVAENPVLDEAGVEAVIDETGKLRLKPRLETDDPIRAPRFQEVEL
ncbi:hypothetical protein HK104_004056 [Borealophlyctis nickersoniae]|nr:hypothetical protein HK104_004056 [Borealophlyctis nickersoniae]